jgi:hypothetical protein
MARTSAFTFPDLAVHHADLGVHDGDLAAHDAPISAFTIARCVQPRGAGAQRLRALAQAQFRKQSERGERFAERVMTSVRTARKQGKDVLDFIVASITAYVDGTTAPRLLGANAVA